MKHVLIAALLLPLMACGGGNQQTQATAEVAQDSAKNQVVETIMTRRSIRQYKPEAVEREKMQTIVECGINAPNAMNRQPWEVRVVDNPGYINGVTELYKKANPQAAADSTFRNMFRNAPTVVFIGHDTKSESSPFDCGLLAENMMLSAWSMGIGSCCLGSPARFMMTPEAAEYLKKLNFSEGYELLYCIGFGYPDETPAAKPRETSKIQFVE